MSEGANASLMLSHVVQAEHQLSYTPRQGVGILLQTNPLEDARSFGTRGHSILFVSLEDEEITQEGWDFTETGQAIDQMRRATSDALIPGTAMCLMWGDMLMPTQAISSAIYDALIRVGIVVVGSILVTEESVYCATPHCNNMDCLPPEGVPRSEVDLMFVDGPPERAVGNPRAEVLPQEEVDAAAAALEEVATKPPSERVAQGLQAWAEGEDLTPQWAASVYGGLMELVGATILLSTIGVEDPAQVIHDLTPKLARWAEEMDTKSMREYVESTLLSEITLSPWVSRDMARLRYLAGALPTKAMPQIALGLCMAKLGQGGVAQGYLGAAPADDLLESERFMLLATLKAVSMIDKKEGGA